MMVRNKKGFVFIVDAIIAIVVLIIGGVLLLNSYYGEPSILQLHTLGSSMVDVYTENTFNQLTSPALSILQSDIQAEFGVQSADYTIAEYMYVLYTVANRTGRQDRGLELIGYIAGNISKQQLPIEANVRITIDDVTVFQDGDVAEDQSIALIPVKNIIYYQEDGQIVGPALFEVAVWR